MTDIPSNAPVHCPGTASDDAGKSSACAGCPNQQICSSGEVRLPDPDIAVIEEKLSTVKKKIVILSGKGGVGKTTVTALLARAISNIKTGDNECGKAVGVLDIDICGPSIPRALGCEGEQVHTSGAGWSPVYVSENLCVMSVGFLVPPEAAVIWRGPKKNGMIKQFLRDVDWGELDVLLVDSPPGTSDEHLSIVQLLSSSLSGAVIVSTPQEVALLDVRKEISFCRRVGLRVLGVVENMAEFVCPKCSKSSVIFPPTSGGVREMCAQMNVPFLGTIPLDPRIGKAIDEGADFFEEFGESPIGNAYKGIAAEMIKNCECSTEQPMEN